MTSMPDQPQPDRAPKPWPVLIDVPGRAADSAYLDALRAVREALDIPHAATMGDDEIRAKILEHRLGHTVAFLTGILGGDAIVDLPWSVAYLKARLAEHPAEGYKTWAERVAELEAAITAGSAR